MFSQWSRHLDSLNSSHSRECVRPQLELWNDRLRQLFTTPPPLVCTSNNGENKDWVYVNNGKFYVTGEAVRKHGEITCDYIPVHRGKDDFEVIF